MSKKALRSVAILVGYDAKENIVYQETLSLDEYYDGSHLWDESKRIKALGLVKLTGTLIDPRGRMLQEFETAFAQKTGKCIGSKAKHQDRTFTSNGIFSTGQSQP